MAENIHSPEVYDFRRYDRVWQRVAPDLEPYPGVNAAAAPAPQPQAAPAGQLARQESQLPGASQDPCCMGSAAAEMLEVLTGFIEEELEDRRYYLAMSRQAPAWARQRLRDIAADEGAHARRLMAAHYLITGQCYRPAIAGGAVTIGRWCPALRERYHMEACNGMNYARSADGTTDPCLAKLLNELSEDEYRHAGELMAMLERSIQG
nr:ferritin-like domain-containing protein [uncultured Oscillibacter sp.]